MHRFYFVRNGAVVCGRDTLAEAIDYAERSRGWDKHQGHHVTRDEFGGERPATYRVEEHVYDATERRWREVARHPVLCYRPPFPSLNEALVTA